LAPGRWPLGYGALLGKDNDLLIIGGGSAGLTAARFASQLELTVALVEKGLLGGDCTWNGCVPSKTLLKAAKSAHAIRNGRGSGSRRLSQELISSR